MLELDPTNTIATMQLVRLLMVAGRRARPEEARHALASCIRAIERSSLAGSAAARRGAAILMIFLGNVRLACGENDEAAAVFGELFAQTDLHPQLKAVRASSADFFFFWFGLIWFGACISVLVVRLSRVYDSLCVECGGGGTSAVGRAMQWCVGWGQLVLNRLRSRRV